MQKSLLLLLVLLLGNGAIPSSGKSAADNPTYQTGRGPIAIHDARPYNLLFLQFLPESPETLPPRANRFHGQLDIINNRLIPSRRFGNAVVEDNEYQRLRLQWWRGLGRGSELSLTVPLLWRNSGFLDSLINGWHRLLAVPGVQNADALYHSILRLTDINDNRLVDQGNAFGLGEVTLTWKRRLILSTPRSALALRLGLKLPTVNPSLLLGSGGFDVGLMLDARYSVGRDILLYAGAGGVLVGHASRVLNAQNLLAQLFFGLEYRPNHRDSFLVQIDGSGAPVRTGNAFADRPTVSFTFGYKRVLDRHLVGVASFPENGDFHDYRLPTLSNIGPDFTISLGLEWHP